MSLESLLEILAYIGGAMFIALLTYLGWIVRRLHTKVEESVSKAELEKSESKVIALISEKELAAAKEISAIKEDTRSMADSVVKAVKSLEDRLDTLMFHLMNQGGGK